MSGTNLLLKNVKQSTHRFRDDKAAAADALLANDPCWTNRPVKTLLCAKMPSTYQPHRAQCTTTENNPMGITLFRVITIGTIQQKYPRPPAREFVERFGDHPCFQEKSQKEPLRATSIIPFRHSDLFAVVVPEVVAATTK